jgi:transcriptional regulator with PAS, ATPase and Fis domain
VSGAVALQDGVVFGRDTDCGAALDGHEVSRRHATIEKTHSLPTIRDLGSRNGTFVNGQRVEERPIGPGDVVRIGEWVGLVQEVATVAEFVELRELGERWWGGQTLARAIEPARRVAVTDLPVIVQGETGTGKEGLARAVHGWSGRPGPFVAVNCAALPEAIAEAELFGYRKGAFTGADRGSAGYFRTAQRGTLFLDEILDLPILLQAKLLRALEQREVQPLGESEPVAVDVRIVCATQEAIAFAVQERRFRADLYARLDGLTVVLPPLRSRREDIVPLFLKILRDQSGGHPPAVDAKLVEAMLLYDWPLNVRELVLLVRRLLAVHSQETVLKRAMLPERMIGRHLPTSTPAQHVPPVRSPTQDEVAFEDLVKALRETAGNVSRAAAALGISRSRAYRLLDARPGFDVRSLREEPE